jgi:ferritin-like metal-binding protein YciE
MGLFTTLSLERMDDLLVTELEDLYDAETRLTKALPKMAEAASNGKLKSAFNQHLRQTEQQLQRLEQAFDFLGYSPTRETCEAMKGLIAEGDEIISADGDPTVKDSALIAAAQRDEHYEIAAYGSARTFAEHLGHNRIANLLQQTLDEEKETDQKLTQIAESSINQMAARA